MTKTSGKHGRHCKCPDCKVTQRKRWEARKTARQQSYYKDRIVKGQPALEVYGYPTANKALPGIYSGGHPAVRWVRDIYEPIDGASSLYYQAIGTICARYEALKQWPPKPSKNKCVSVWEEPYVPMYTLDRVYHLRLDTGPFDKHPGPVSFLWHGTGIYANVNSIARESLRASTGGLLGPGVYLAPEQCKAFNYTGMGPYRMMFYCAVKLGRPDAVDRDTGQHDTGQHDAKAWRGGDHKYANAGAFQAAWSGSLNYAEYCVRDPSRVLPVVLLVYKDVVRS